MIYRIHANLCLYPNIKIYHDISKIKNRTHLSWVDLTFERYEDVKVFRVFLLITNGKKGHLDENYVHHCYGILYYSESYSHDQSFFSTVMRHNGNSISKDILQKILRTWERINYFIETLHDAQELGDCFRHVFRTLSSMKDGAFAKIVNVF